MNTDVYTTERLDITNINQTSTALTVRQMGESKKIISALKDSEPDVEIFSVNTDGSIDVKGNINFGGDLFKGTEKFKASNWTSNVNGITSYSNVAIGKDVATNSVYKLDVGGNVNISGDLYKGGSIFKASNWTSNINGITSYSNVAIGKDVATNSAYKLDIGGNVNISGDLYKDGSIFKASNWTSNVNGLFYNSTSVGIGTTAILANVLFQVGNGGALRITNNPLNYSLIGTDSTETNSNTRIVLSGNTRTENLGNIEYASTSTGGHMFFTTNSKTERMRITTLGNVGIGTNNPNANLHLHGNAASQNIRISFTDNTSGVATTDGFCIGKDTTQKGYIYNTENADIEIGTNNIARITITASGAISTNNNNINAGSATITAATFSGALSGNATTATNASGLTGTPNITVGTISCSTITGSGQLNQITNNTDGGVGLNIKNNSSGSSAFSSLAVQNSAGTVCSIFLNSSTRTNDGGINTATLRNDAGDLRLAAAGDTSYMYLKNSNGNVGINIINPKEKLDVNGNIIASGSITSFGDYSDERLKDREGNIENPLDIIGKLQGFYYKPNKIANDLGIKGNKTNKRELGVSAQDVQKILPELIDIAPVDISYDAENNVISKTGSNYLTVNYEKMIPLLIESIKELNKNINELKKENVELRDLIKSQ